MTEQFSDDGAREFVECDRATRLKVLVFAGILLLLIVLERLTAPGRGMLATDPMQALNKSADRLFYVVLVAVPLFVGASMYLLQLAVKISRSSQWPAPGMRVAVRTRVLRGRRARWNAILAVVLAAILMVATPALIFAWYSLSRLVHELNPPHKRTPPAPTNGAADWQRST